VKALDLLRTSDPEVDYSSRPDSVCHFLRKTHSHRHSITHRHLDGGVILLHTLHLVKGAMLQQSALERQHHKLLQLTMGNSLPNEYQIVDEEIIKILIVRGTVRLSEHGRSLRIGKVAVVMANRPTSTIEWLRESITLLSQLLKAGSTLSTRRRRRSRDKADGHDDGWWWMTGVKQRGIAEENPARQDTLYVTTHKAFSPIGSHPLICHEDTTRYDITG